MSGAAVWFDGPMSERWETHEEIVAAYQLFAEQAPGFKPPAAYGLGIVEGDGVRFPHVNQGEHLLPAVVLALVCGYRKGTRVIQLGRDQLDRAIDLLAPAEACTIYRHPNLWAWRTMRADAGPEATYVAVFVGDLADPVTDEHDAVFRSTLVARASEATSC